MMYSVSRQKRHARRHRGCHIGNDELANGVPPMKPQPKELARA
jgi:hypothetical protein